MKRIRIYLIIISLCSISGSYTTRVHATIDIGKGERLIYHKQYDEAYHYFLNGAGDEVTPNIREQKDKILNYLKIVRYAQNNLQAHHQGNHITFHYNASLIRSDEIALLTQRYDRSYRDIKKELAISFGQPVHIFLYPEGMELALWESLGLLSVYNSDEIHVFYGGVDNHGQIEHEMVHIMTEHLNSFRGRSTLPALLIEGLAEYIVDDPWGLELNQWVKGFMELGVFLPLTELQDDVVFRKHNQIITYEEAGSFVHYLITQYGLDKFKLLYSQPSFYPVYGKTLEELAQEWSCLIRSAAVSAEDRELISFRVALGALYMKPVVLAQVPWIGIKTFINQERVFIEHVAESSPAERGELKEGDEVVGVDDIALHGKNVWRIGSLLLDKNAGDCVSFAVRRDGKIVRREITLGVKPYRTWQ
jgi:hypothetical protein